METETKHPTVSRPRGMIAAILIVATLWTMLHVYVGQRLLAQTPLAPAWRLLGWVGILLLILAPFVALFAGRTQRLPAKRGLEIAGFTAMGLSSLLIVFALAGDALHVRAWLGVGGFQLAVVGGAVAVLLIGLWRARRPAMVRVVDVPITGLPSDLEGFRIAQLSDLHVGPTLKREFVERVVDTTNGLRPDLIALTGDVADGFPPALRDEVAPLAGLRAPHGKYFVTGNHEYYWDAAGWVREMEGLGFNTLVNGHQLIRRGTGRIVLAGVTDFSSRGVPGHISDPAAAVAGAPESDVRVLPAEERVRGTGRWVRPATVGAHPRRTVLPVQPAGAAVPAVCRGTPPAGGDVVVREPGDGLLGATAAPGRTCGDHADSAYARVSASAHPNGWHPSTVRS